MSEHDFIVVGGGTAGAVVAYRLAEAGHDVALLEAGPTDLGKDEVQTLRRWQELLGSPLDYDYVIEEQVRGNRRIRQSRAKVLGGCSSHNSCIAFRTPAADLDLWASLGASGWEAARSLPFFERVLDKVNLETPPAANACGRAMIEAAEAAGYPEQTFGPGEVRTGVGWFQLNKRGERRHSSAVAYLHEAAKLPERLHVVTDCAARQILLGDSRARGVRTTRGDFTVRRDIVLSAGAFDTPKLLMLSGIGPAKELARHGIEVRHDLGGVGENLLDHPEGVIIWEASRPVPEVTTQWWEIGLFCQVDDSAPAPDLMFHFGTQSFDMHTRPDGYPFAAEAFSLTPNVARARSQGVVRLRSADPAAPPVIDPRYFTDPDGYDERIMVEGIRVARRVAAAEPLAGWVARELAPGPGVTSDEDISHYVRTTANTVYHPAGTCRMGGAGDGDAVVDPELRVRGIDGLRIADASVFPTMIGVNPCLTVMMIGERCADFMLRS